MSGHTADRLVRVTHWLVARTWRQLAALAATIATAANLAVFAFAAGSAGIDVRSLGPIPLWLLLIAIYTVVPASVATLLAAGLARRTAAAWRWFVGIAVVVLLLSFAAPPLLLETTVAIVLMLDLMHVVAAAVIVAALTPRLRSA